MELQPKPEKPLKTLNIPQDYDNTIQYSLYPDGHVTQIAMRFVSNERGYQNISIGAEIPVEKEALEALQLNWVETE